MKRLIWLVIVSVFFFSSVYAQNNDVQFNAIKKRIEKLEKKLQDPKYASNYKLWAKLAKLYLDAYSVNVRIPRGYEAKLLPFFKVDPNDPESEPFYGKPKKVEKKGDKEYWYYDKIVFIAKNGVIIDWKNLKLPVQDPLIKAFDAYQKAIELDKSGKFLKRSSTQRQLFKLRKELRSMAGEAYNKREYDKALDLLLKVEKLYNYPRPKNDTAGFKPGELEYYIALSAYNAGKYETAAEYFKKAIDKGYEVGNSYQLLAQSLIKLGRDQEAVKLLEEGVKKYPTESKIIFALIDYYKPRGQLDKAFYYLDKAIELNPDLGILYLVKADGYSQIFSDYAEEYRKYAHIADSLRKAAFRNRNNPEVHDKILKEKDSLDKLAEQAKQQALKYYDLSEQWFKKGIAKTPNNPNGHATLGYLYYKRAKLANFMAQLVPYNQEEKFKQLKQEYKEYLEKAREEYEKAVQLDPNDRQSIRSLAKIYYQLGMTDKSDEMVKKLKALEKQQATQTQGSNK